MDNMGKKSGKGLQILLRLDDDPELAKKFRALQHYYGSKAGVEVLRNLINDKYRVIMKEKL
jgi:hypothetical protein